MYGPRRVRLTICGNYWSSLHDEGVIYLTAHEKDSHPDADRPTDEIEVTPEMLEAGMHEYDTRWRSLRDADDDVAREMLLEAYRAMFRLRP